MIHLETEKAEQKRLYSAKRYREKREQILLTQKEHYANSPEYRKKTIERANLQNNTVAGKARQAVRNAIYWKGLKREPCEVCGDPKTHAHHEDYSKPLKVNWLCSKHHGEKHRKYAPQDLERV